MTSGKRAAATTVIITAIVQAVRENRMRELPPSFVETRLYSRIVLMSMGVSCGETGGIAYTRVMRLRAVLGITAAVCLALTIVPLRAADTLPAQISDAAYWKMISDFS